MWIGRVSFRRVLPYPRSKARIYAMSAKIFVLQKHYPTLYSHLGCVADRKIMRVLGYGTLSDSIPGYVRYFGMQSNGGGVQYKQSKSASSRSAPLSSRSVSPCLPVHLVTCEVVLDSSCRPWYRTPYITPDSVGRFRQCHLSTMSNGGRKDGVGGGSYLPGSTASKFKEPILPFLNPVHQSPSQGLLSMLPY